MDAENILLLRASLSGSSPEIWRRLEVPEDFSFGELHELLQVAFEWEDSHLHEFEVGERRIGLPDPEGDSDAELEDELDVSLGEALGRRKKLTYRYDFGDSWKVELTVEGKRPAEEGVRYPRVTAGERAGPLEDSGGVGGYEHKLQVLADPDHEEHEELAEWMGEGFDPARFELAEVNAQLQELWRAPLRQQAEDVAYALALAPMEDESALYVLIAHGREPIPVRAGSAAEALKELASHASGLKLRCEEALAEAGAPFGFEPAPVTEEAGRIRAILTWALAHGDHAPSCSPQETEELFAAAAMYARSEPWGNEELDYGFRVTVERGGKARTYEAVNALEDDELPTLRLVEGAGGLARVLEAARRGGGLAAVELLGVTLQAEPDFAVDAIAAAYDLALMPRVFRTKGTEERPATAEEVETLTLAMAAIAARGEGEEGPFALETTTGTATVTIGPLAPATKKPKKKKWKVKR